MNILVFTDNDLDGAGSALFIKWLYNTKIVDFIVIETSELSFTNEINNRKHTLDHFDKVFVLDLDLSPEQIEVVDRSNFVIVDHHIPHSKKVTQYKNAKAIIEPYTSCIKLLKDKFSSVIMLTSQQDELIKYIDDYDSYKLQYSDSLKLNAIHKTYNKPKVDKFIEAFYGGFRSYTPHEKNGIKLFIKKFRDQLQGPIYMGTIKDYKVVSIFADYAVSEVAHFIISRKKADIGIVINLDAKVVSFRRSKECEADVSVLAKAFCAGGGSPAIAGGKLTDEFANLTKNFLPC